MGRIVVGVDGSEGSKLALSWAFEQAKLRGAQVEAVYVYEHTPSWQLYAYGEGAIGVVGEAPVVDVASEREAAEQRAAELLHTTIEQVEGGAEVVLEPIVVEDRRPARHLVERSKTADMLVIGSRGRGGFTGLLLGSVSQQCTQHASCPVVVINAPGHDD